MQFICEKILFLMVLGIYKMHVKESNTKKRVYNYYFDNLSKEKKVETKNIKKLKLKNYKDLQIYFTRYVHSKFIKILDLHYHELLANT